MRQYLVHATVTGATFVLIVYSYSCNLSFIEATGIISAHFDAPCVALSVVPNPDPMPTESLESTHRPTNSAVNTAAFGSFSFASPSPSPSFEIPEE